MTKYRGEILFWVSMGGSAVLMVAVLMWLVIILAS
jgi:hypothetical protein